MNRDVDFTQGLEQAWANFITFLPKLLLFLVILVAGWMIAKVVARLFDKVLERVGFDRLVERGGIKRVLSRTRYDASDFLTKLLFYTLVLVVLQMAFAVFGPNPVSNLLNDFIAYLPNIFVAAVIVVIAAGVASAVKDIIGASLSGVFYGKYVANAAAAAILIIGGFAALDQLQIAPAIVTGLFYGILALVVGSGIIAIGGGGIAPMRGQWERVMNRMKSEAPKIQSAAQAANPPASGAPPRIVTPHQGMEGEHEPRHFPPGT